MGAEETILAPVNRPHAGRRGAGRETRVAATTTTEPGRDVHTAMAAIACRLRALRRAVRVWLLLDGACALVTLAVALAAASLAVDRLLRMDRAQRAVCLGLAAALLAGAAWRRLARPLLARLDDETLCLRVEARHRRLGQSLISAVQFARGFPDLVIGPRFGGAEAERPPRAPGRPDTLYSPALIRATIAQGARAAATVDFGEVLDRRRHRRNLLQGGALAAVAGLACLLFPGTAGLWFRRCVLLGRAEWPRKTHLVILGAEDGRLTVPRGDDLEVRVVADPDRVVPRRVRVDYRAPGEGGVGTDELPRVGDNEFPWTIENVQSAFEFRARGGDDVTDWVRVDPVERPAVERLTLVAEPPSYTGLPPARLAPAAGAYALLAGSRLEIAGRANKPLASATLLPPGKGAAPLTMAVDADGAFRCGVPPGRLASGAYAVALTDTGGLASKQPRRFRVRLVADRKPVVRLKLDGIGEMITPRAVLPLRCDLSDDYAVAEARLVWCLAREEEGSAPPQILRLDALEEALGRKKIERLCRIEAASLGAKEGAILTLHLEAMDNDTRSGPKAALSGSYALKVVTRETLLSHLLRREQELRLEFERLFREQRRLLEDSKAMQAGLRLRPGDPIAPRDRQRLTRNEKRQRLARSRCLAVASRFAEILAEVRNNRLDATDGELPRRLSGQIITPLRALAREAVPRAADRLEAAARHADEPPRAAEALVGAVAEQTRIVAAMQRILQSMVKWEGYEEAVRLLRDLLRGQEDLRRKTAEELERRIRGIFEGGG